MVNGLGGIGMSDNAGQFWFGGMVAGALVMAAGYGISTDKDLWLGDAGLAQAVSGLGTLVALVAGGVVAYNTYQASLRTDRANRAGKSAELISGSSASGRVLGMHVLRGVAKEDPNNYLVATLHVLLQVIYDADGAVKDEMAFHILPLSPYEGTWPVAEKITADAISILATLADPTGVWPESADVVAKGKLYVSGAYLAGFDFHGEKLRNCMFNRVVMHNVKFIGADFRDSSFIGAIGQFVSFEGCDLRGTSIQLKLADGNDAIEHPRFVSFDAGCLFDDRTRFNGQPIPKERWKAGAE